MKLFRHLAFFLLVSALICGNVYAEQQTPSEYMKSIGYSVYTVGKIESIGIDGAVFSGDNSDYSLCGCLHDSSSNVYAFFWRESDGSVYVAKSAAASILGAFSPMLSNLGSIKQFTDMCEQCGFSLGLYIDGGAFTFGMATEDEKLIALSRTIAEGAPMTYRVGWENYYKALTMPGLY